MENRRMLAKIDRRLDMGPSDADGAMISEKPHPSCNNIVGASEPTVQPVWHRNLFSAAPLSGRTEE